MSSVKESDYIDCQDAYKEHFGKVKNLLETINLLDQERKELETEIHHLRMLNQLQSQKLAFEEEILKSGLADNIEYTTSRGNQDKHIPDKHLTNEAEENLKVGLQQHQQQRQGRKSTEKKKTYRRKTTKSSGSASDASQFQPISVLNESNLSRYPSSQLAAMNVSLPLQPALKTKWVLLFVLISFVLYYFCFS